MASKYHKIDTVFKRDPDNNFKTLLDGQYSRPEFEFLSDNEWVFTEKVDGTNIRVIIENGNIIFGGKTDNAQIPAPLLQVLQNKFLPLPMKKRLLEEFPDGVVFYGEGYGAKIQKGGGNYRPDQSFVLFDIKIGEWWLERENIEGIAKLFGMEIVPIVGRGTLTDMVGAAINGYESKWGCFLAEGLVARPSVELKSRNGSRIITKIKLKDFP